MRLLILLAFCCVSLARAAAPQPPSIIGKSWLVADFTSGQVLATGAAGERIEPASLTKLMTAYLAFSAIRDKKVSPEQRVTVSEKAARAPGARMFIRAGTQVGIDDLIRGMVVQSANDASIALAEAVAGSEDAFTQAMNKEAERLGMKDTSFRNATGLPDPQHYTTARDLYVLAAALIRDFPQPYAQYYSQKEFRYNSVSQPNRNRLLWIDPSVDGMKTGHTESAGFCLIASAKRGERRLVSVLIGATSDAARAQESLKLLNWGFQFFDDVKLEGANQEVKALQVWKGAARTVKAGFASDVVLTVPRGEGEKLKAELLSQQPLVAPVSQGQRVGTLRVFLEGKPLGEYPLVALEPVPVAGLFGRAWDTLRLWLK
jgi:D-alanyl-D-alanine carboxypeptidase (penicillin-binding protein 5/6)